MDAGSQPTGMYGASDTNAEYGAPGTKPRPPPVRPNDTHRSLQDAPKAAAPSARSDTPRVGTWVGLLALVLVLVPGSSALLTELAPLPVEETPDGALPGQPGDDERGDAELVVRLDATLFAELPEGAFITLHGDDVALRRAMRGAVPVHLTNLPAGTFTLTLHVPGFVATSQEVTLESGTSIDATSDLAPAARARIHVEGRETSERQGTPLPLDDISVFAVPPGRQHPRFVAHVEGDVLVFDTLPPDTDLVLYATAPGYERSQQELRSPAAGSEIAASIALAIAAQLAGVVVDPSGAPVGDARVVLAGSGVWPPREVETDASGRFAWPNVPAGIYELRASHGNWVGTPRGGIVVGRHAPTPFVRLQLMQGAVLTGVVHDEAGAPLPDAEILVLEEAISLLPRAATSGATGAFTVVGLLPQEHVVRVFAEGFVPFQGEHDPREGPLEVTLQRAASLAGRVIDSYGHPVAGALVEVVDDAPHASLNFADLFAVQRRGPVPLTSDGALGVTLGEIPPIPLDVSAVAHTLTGQAVTEANGAFVVTGITPGRVRLRVSAPSYAPLSTQPFTLRPGEDREGVELVLQPGTLIEGRVVDASNFPVANVIVELRMPGHPQESTMSASDGTFTFQAGRGDVTLTASPPALPAVRVRVALEDVERQEVTLRLTATLHTLRGRVFDLDELPVAGATLRLESLSARFPHHRVMVAADDGSFEMTGLPPPPYRVVVTHEELADEELDVTTTADDLEVVLLPAGTLRGTVVDDIGPAPEVEVVLYRDGRPRQQAYTDIEGRFVFERIGVGDYTLQLSSVTHLPAEATASLVLRRGEVIAYVDEITLTRGAHISGLVVDMLGEAAVGAEVAVGPDPDWSRAARVNDAGEFVLGPVLAGDLMLMARHPTAGTGNTTRPVRVDAGELVQDAYIRLSGRVPLPNEEGTTELRAEDPEQDGGAGQRVTGVAIALAMGAREVEVSAVVEGSRAARSGLRVGDQLIEIDDMPVNSPGEARSMLRGAEGVAAILRIRRGRQERLIQVVRERYSQP